MLRVLARGGEDSLTSSPSDGGRMRWGSANSELWREADYRQIRNLDIEVGVVISNVLQGGRFCGSRYSGTNGFRCRVSCRSGFRSREEIDL